jgi:hypothetical protein
MKAAVYAHVFRPDEEAIPANEIVTAQEYVSRTLSELGVPSLAKRM